MPSVPDIHRRGTRAAQPAASTVTVGTLYFVTDQNVTERSTGSAWESYSGAGGGGGNTTSSGPAGSEPASPTTGDLYFPTNAFSLERYSGTAWLPWGPLFPMTRPIDSEFTWINQGTASVVVTANSGLFLRSPISAGVNLRIRKKTAPATPYTITAAFLPATVSINFQTAGVCFRQASSSAIETFDWSTSTSGISYVINRYTNATTYSATVLSVAVGGRGPLVWLRITDDGVNRLFSYSVDGQNWIAVTSTPRTTFLTADEVGFYANDQTNTYEAGLTLLSWKQT